MPGSREFRAIFLGSRQKVFADPCLKEPLTVSVGDSEKTTLPSGSNVAVQIFAQHRNPHVWEDPEVRIEFNEYFDL